jgi:hypothetical protein
MLIDFMLLPLGIVKGLLIGGVPDVCQELRRWPRDFASNWRAAGWISAHSNAICVKPEEETKP